MFNPIMDSMYLHSNFIHLFDKKIYEMNNIKMIIHDIGDELYISTKITHIYVML